MPSEQRKSLFPKRSFPPPDLASPARVVAKGQNYRSYTFVVLAKSPPLQRFLSSPGLKNNHLACLKC